jgi:hypothetical protein
MAKIRAADVKQFCADVKLQASLAPVEGQQDADDAGTWLQGS